MARRSPTNERYQKHTGPAGKTRKSAAAAKPKRSDASGSGSPAKKTSSAPKKREPMVMHPPTAEYKRWRRIWWGFLGAAIVLTTIAYFVTTRTDYVTLGNVLLGAGYAAIFGALYLDWTKLRKLRAEWMKAGKPAETPAEKPAKDDADKPSSDETTS